MTLDCVKPGQGGIITVVGGDGALRRRLLDMGLTPKTKVMGPQGGADGRPHRAVPARLCADHPRRGRGKN